MRYGFFIGLFVLSAMATPVVAQDVTFVEVDPQPAMPESVRSVETNLEENIEDERRALTYVPATHASLSRLLWKFRVYEKPADKVYTDYLRTANCLLFQQYFDDDFLWNNIVEGAKREIDYYSGDYPSRLEVKATVVLGRYDFKKLGFEIADGFKLEHSGAFVFPFPDFNETDCKTNYATESFPQAMRFLPDNTFKIDMVPMGPDKARSMLDDLKGKTYDGNVLYGDRIVTLRVRLKVNSVDATGTLAPTGYVFLGQLDEIAFFEDDAMEHLIWKKSFKNLE